MTKRTWMIKKRERLKLSRAEMAVWCSPYGCNGTISERLIGMLEDDAASVTHPNLARRIADVYGLTDKQYIGLLPENYRPGPNYDPDRYVIATDYSLYPKMEV